MPIGSAGRHKGAHRRRTVNAAATMRPQQAAFDRPRMIATADAAAYAWQLGTQARARHGIRMSPPPDGFGLSAAVFKDLMKPLIGIQVVSIWR
ncbi:hypothetical protein [Burkholderia diffusa]|uniref:hypothetical protein n=1 Tax=Burkholderia diffusa TaxID=488732 RepID=UPI0014798112|nr:hypothetical protein [Burkholderia diffusa]